MNILNIAIGFSILLYFAISWIGILTGFYHFLPPTLVALLSSSATFSVLVTGVFLCLRFTCLYKYLKLTKGIQITFAISNILIIGSIILTDLGLKGADGPVGFAVMLFFGMFMLLGLIILLFGAVTLLIRSYQEFRER
jgi:hypothetical protein